MNPAMSDPNTHRSTRGDYLRMLCLLAIVLMALCYCTDSSHAAVTPTGDVTPTYDGSDPWALGNKFLYVGDTGTGSLQIDSASVVYNSYSYLGYAPGAAGNVTVTGDGSLWNNSGRLTVGYSGTGTLNVEDSGTVFNYYGILGYYGDSSGTATVTGTGSVWNNSIYLYVGLYGTGMLNIENGGTVNTPSGYLGDESGSSGVVTINGAGSVWSNTKYLYVGHSGTGILNVENGGTVNTPSGSLGYENGSSGTATVTGAGSVWNNSDNLYVGYNGTGILNIENGGTVNNTFGRLGGQDGSSGTVTVTGSGSVWDNTESLIVGSHGTGTLNIENGGTVNIAKHTGFGLYPTGIGILNLNNGTLNTEGLWASSSLLFGTGTINTQGIVSDVDLVFNADYGLHQQIILNSLPGQDVTINLDVSNPAIDRSMGAGYAGTGTLVIEDSLVVSSYDGYMGYHAGSSGTATINGTGSEWNNSHHLFVGYDGSGTLNVENSGTASSVYSTLGNGTDSSGTATITGAGSEWNNTADLFVGGYGTATLNVESGGTVNNRTGYLGFFEGSSGTATVAGAGSVWNNASNLHVGNRGTGTLIIDHEATVNARNGVSIAKYYPGSGTVNLQGGTLDLNGSSITAGNGDAAFNFTGGTLKDAGLIDLKLPFVQAGGALAPGGSIGQTDIIGDYQLTAGTVEIELGGLDNPHDLLTTSGNIDIALTGTTLDLLPLGPMQAGTYSLVESTGLITGTFEHITGLAEYPGLVGITYESNAIKITLNHDFVPGDLNADGFVGLDDLDILLAHWNQSVPVADLASGDYSRDGYVGLDDLDVVLFNWNQGTPPADITQNIPEPTASVLLGIATLACFGRKSCVR